ncbi:glycosyltransferase family 2 protein [Agromyces ramosus]|uniref:Glycosyltransferase involved in cell wall biosynthesis n=1 Tax=Agromyces ramosus TaxID=33879 RepID=A0ABU0RBG4_9MICO|nr:glycosyltransferase family 2 protein [Agromyces ramosus]MDQ0895420.1 glycosyltransferase involved in cell wall biosynthesis [Agromyces ramosus]
MTDTGASPRVSVALCTHNGDRYLAEQMRSIFAQSVAPQEIIVSDDASSDSTVALVEQLRSEAAPIEVRLLRNSAPLGVTANFERAIAAASGDFVALCDQDDVWHPQKLERMLRTFASSPGLLLVHTDARIVDEGGRPSGASLFETLRVSATERARVHAGDAISVLLRRNIVTGATTVLRRELATRAMPFPGAWVHDEWLAIVAAATGRIDLLEELLIDYRQHGGNQIGASTLTGRGRIGRLSAPRTERNARLLARAVALAERMTQLEPAPTEAAIRGAEDVLAHERARSALPSSRVRRIAPVVREWRTGRYSTCGLGLQDVVRDLVQPAR